MKIINVPTGKIILGEYQGRQFECLSLGDYGKDKNVKADFLGNIKEIEGVPNDATTWATHWIVFFKN